MHQSAPDPTDHCINGRCWSGPILIVSTKGGAIPDLRTWIQIMLSRHFNKETTLGLMACLELTHVWDEHAIMCFATGRDPQATALREVYCRVKLDHDGVLRSNTSTYHFAIVGEGEQARCDALISHYGWLDGMARCGTP